MKRNEETNPKQMIIGCWQLSSGHSNRFDLEKIFAQLEQYNLAGFTTFDCGDIYTGVEEVLGAFRARSDHNFQVNTKFVPDLDQLPTLTTKYIDQIIDRSLSRLRIEALDLVQFHWWDFTILGYIEAAQHLAKLQQAGKIRQIGTTNFDTMHLSELIDAGVTVVSNQVQFSLIDRRPTKTLLKYAASHEIELLCYGTLAGGLMSDQWLGLSKQDYEAVTRSHTKYRLIIDDIGGWDSFQALLQSLQGIAYKHQVSLAVVANAYIIGQPNCRAIVGFSYQDRIGELQQMLTLKLDDEDFRRLEKITQTFTPLKGDVYELERDRAGRHGRIMKYNLNQE